MRQIPIISLVLFLAGTVINSTPVFAEETAYRYIEDSMPRIIVEGVGRLTAKPDEAVIKLGIINEERSLKKAFEHQTEEMNKVINEIKSLGIKDEDIKTLSYNIIPMIKGGPIWWGKRKPDSFEVSHTLSVKLKDLSKIGDVIDKVIAAGAIYIYGLEFKSSKIEELEKEVRLKAAKNAKEKAQILADGIGFKIGKVLRVDESMEQRLFERSRHRPEYDKMFVAKDESAPPQIEPGSIELEAICTVIYEVTQ